MIPAARPVGIQAGRTRCASVRCLAAAGALWSAAAAADPAARSAVYGSLTLVADGKAVAGVFAEQRGMDGPGGAPQFSCLFLLRGELAGDRARVETWFPGEAERIAGELVFRADGAALTLRADHGGCGMTTGSMVGQPYEMARDEEGSGWVGVALVTAKRATFRPAPSAAAPRAPYLVAFDPVAILEQRDGWVRALYRGGAKPVTGWLPAGDLAIARP